MTLTTTQHSALGELHRFGRLYPPGARQLVDRGTSHGFSRRTLQSLVDAGYAVWDRHTRATGWSVIPIPDPGPLRCDECGFTGADSRAYTAGEWCPQRCGGALRVT